MRKTLVYLVLLIVLAAGVYYLVFNNKRSLFTAGDANFNVADTGALGKIFLADGLGRTILLERTDTGWMVNKTYHALNSTLNNLLITMKTQTVLYPVPENTNNTVIKNMAGNATKVELYDLQGKKTRSFYVGGASLSGNGSYMLMDGGKQPYIVYITGQQGYINTRYDPEMKNWRDRTVFNVDSNHVARVSVEYPDAKLNDFVLTRVDGKANVAADPAIIGKNPLNMGRVKRYVKFFYNINCEGYFNGVHSGLDTILKPQLKFCSVELTATNGRTQHVDVYWMPLNKRSKNITQHAEGIPDEYDADRFFGVMNNYKDTVLLQRRSLFKIFRNAYDFYQPDEQRLIPPAGAVPSNVLMHKKV